MRTTSALYSGATSRCRIVKISLPADAPAFRHRLSSDVAQGIWAADSVDRSVGCIRHLTPYSWSKRSADNRNGRQLRQLDSVPFAISMGSSSAALRAATLIFPEFFSALWPKHDAAPFSALLFHLFCNSSLPYSCGSGKEKQEKGFCAQRRRKPFPIY